MLVPIRPSVHSASGRSNKCWNAVFRSRKEELFFGEKQGQQGFFGFPGRMDRIHLDIVREGKGTEVAIGSVGKDCPVRDLYFMALSWLEMDFPLQSYVPCRKESLVGQRGNDLVLLAKLSFGHVDPCSGIPEFFPVFPVSEPGNILKGRALI